MFSDRLIRPGDQAYFDIIHVFNGYRTCYYRTFVVGRATEPQRDAFKQTREWMDVALALVKPGTTTDEIAKVWPRAEEFGFEDEMDAFGLQFGHGVGVGLHERPIISRLNSLESPIELQEGMVFALETYAPATDGRSAARIEEEVVVTADGCKVITLFPVKSSWWQMPTDPRSDYALREPRLPKSLDETMANADIAIDVRLGMYRKLHELRQFGKRAHDLFLQNLVKGTTHLSLGMEAVATGFGAALEPDDYTFATYRGHAHSLARGMDLGAGLAELLGRENGVLGGKGGSMHLADASKGMMGSYAIIGAHLCVANGAAWSAQMRGTRQVAVAFFGDGTTNIGAFHEALNLAKIWELPVVFVCENNLYMEYTPIDLITAVAEPAAGRAAAYGLEPILIDGNDPDAVYLAAVAALAKARSGGGPSLIEALTYRSGGHSRADPGKYRPQAEVDAWLDRDPLPMYHERLLSLGTPEIELTSIVQQVADAIDAATEFAKAGREPGEETLMTEVFADGGSGWRN